MKIIKNISEDEMISIFLKGEIQSFRFGEKILKQLEKDQKDRSVIDKPDILNNKENEYRKIIFGNYRGYGLNKDLFENFPNNIEWKRVILDKQDLLKIKYINYDYWVELSGGSRLVSDGAKNVVAGIEIFKQPNKNFWEAAKKVEQGGSFPEPILVATNISSSGLIILEGHLRLTAYFIKPEYIPKELSAIVGISENIVKWDLY